MFISATYHEKGKLGSDGIRTHASEETGALNQRLDHLATLPDMEAQEILTSLHLIGAELVVAVDSDKEKYNTRY